jgi:uncharacterized protein YrrD
MLIQASKIIGKKVITMSDGKEVSEVKDLVYDPRENHVSAILVDDGGWFSDAKVIAFSDITSIGSDAVMINDEQRIREAKEINQRVSNIARDDQYLTKTKVMTESGESLGEVTDLFFDGDNGRVEEFEVTQGQLQTIKSGKKRIKVQDILTIGEDATIVRNQVLGELEEQEKQGGAMGVIEESKQKLSQGFEEVKEKIDTETSESRYRDPNTLEQLKADAKEEFNKIRGQAEEAFHSAKHDFSERQRHDAVGKYLTVNVLDGQDQLVAQRGQIVTREVLSKASAAGVENKVISNVSKVLPTDTI